MSTFVATGESEIETMIKNPGSLVQVSTVFKVFKVSLIIMTFSFNGNVNDYFVGCFFWYTGLIGKIYFSNVGLRQAHFNFEQHTKDQEITPDHLDNQNLSHYLDQIMAISVEDCI